MNTNEKLVAAARRAAKTLSRTSERSYQTCLDEVARSAGRSTWSSFLADPVAIDASAADAAAEPDFTLIVPETHLSAVVRHGIRVGATHFMATPKAWDDDAPLLRYRLEDGRAWPVDARGLSLDALAVSCGFAPPPTAHSGSEEGEGEEAEGMATCSGMLMRTLAHRWTIPEGAMVAVSASIDGSHPERIRPPEPAIETEPKVDGSSRRVAPKRSMTQKLKRLMIGEDEASVRDMIDRRIVGSSAGPVIGILKNGRRVRLRPGAHLAAFSPPGTGRMVGITIPALLGDDATSYVVHDDGQLLANTQAWRRSIGRVAVIRLDAATHDAINPFGHEWIPTSLSRLLDYCDRIAMAIAPYDARVARLIGQTAFELIGSSRQTTIRAVMDAIAVDQEGSLARLAVAALMPLASPLAESATSRSTIVPSMLHGDADGRPLTIYIVRDPMACETRSRLAAAIQSAIWYNTMLHGPGKPVAGRADNGPCPLGTIMHDFHRLPVMPMLASVMGYGADTGASIIITGSTAATIGERYRNDVGVIEAMIDARLVLQQSDGREIALIDPNRALDASAAASLGRWQSVLLARGCPPARMRLPIYFEDPEMVRRSNLQG